MFISVLWCVSVRVCLNVSLSECVRFFISVLCLSLSECVCLCSCLSVSVFYNTHSLEFGGRPKRKTSNEKKADLKRLSRKLNDDVDFVIWCLSDQLLKSTR